MSCHLARDASGPPSRHRPSRSRGVPAGFAELAELRAGLCYAVSVRRRRSLCGDAAGDWPRRAGLRSRARLLTPRRICYPCGKPKLH